MQTVCHLLLFFPHMHIYLYKYMDVSILKCATPQHSCLCWFVHPLCQYSLFPFYQHQRPELAFRFLVSLPEGSLVQGVSLGLPFSARNCMLGEAFNSVCHISLKGTPTTTAQIVSNKIFPIYFYVILHNISGGGEYNSGLHQFRLCISHF